MKQKKFNRASDTMKQLYKSKNIFGLQQFKKDYPIYSLKADCYILRLQKKGVLIMATKFITVSIEIMHDKKLLSSS